MQNVLVQEGAFSRSLRKAINDNFTQVFGGIFWSGNRFYLDPATGSDANDGLSPSTALRTLSAAYAKCTAGQNDAVVLLSDGSTTDTARVDASFTWSKNATHLIGVSSGVNISNRSRIAPTSGAAAFTPYFLVSASGCLFQNIQWFMGFTVGGINQIGMNVTGSRNLFLNCHIAGLCDTDSASAADAGSRTLKIGSAGSGENMFVNCCIGVDTVTRSAANASVELAGATPRNQFVNCLFPFMTSNAGVLGILGTGASCVDRFNYFENCAFMNAIKSTSTQMTVLGSFTDAAPGGMVVLGHCRSVGSTKFGDANFLANSFIDMPATSAAAGGLMLAPS
jgi:hypothetical protein